MKKIGWMWLAGLAFASSVQAQKIEEVLQSVEQNNKELQAVFHSTEAAKMDSFEEFLKSFQSARMAGFTNINIDLMSGIPGQTLESWKNTLKKVTMLKPEHISAYSLIIEEGTPFWNRFGEGKCACGYTGPALPDEDTENKIYRFTRKFLQEQGFERYEISNYAKPGKECRHNIGYWTEVAYLGLGLGASSYMEGCRFTNEKDLDKYLALDFGEEDPEKRETALRKLWGQIEELSQAQRMEEFMFLGLRMLKGVSDVDFVRLFGVKMETVYGDVIRRLTANGLLKKEENNLALTEWGMDVSNFVLTCSSWWRPGRRGFPSPGPTPPSPSTTACGSGWGTSWCTA